jgi:hypothetical protein
MSVTTKHLEYAREYARHRILRDREMGLQEPNEAIWDTLDQKEFVTRVTGEYGLLDDPYSEAWEIIQEFENTYFDNFNSEEYTNG